MTDKKRILFSGAKILALGQVSDGVSRFVRNLLVARVLAPADFGIGATFAISVMFLEMLSHLGLEMMLIQAKDGEKPVMQATAHTMMVIRGALIGVAIFLGAPVIVQLFHIPHAEWAFRVLAIAPVITGFTHLDKYRLQRQFRFGAFVISDMGAKLFATLVAWPVAKWYGDYVALLWLSLTIVIISTALSHLLRERPYRLGWDRRYVVRFMSFGWPLLLNGILLFGTMQGDRTIIGAGYDMATLGVFTIAFQLAAMPTQMIWGVVHNMTYPMLAAVQDHRSAFNRHYHSVADLIGLVGGSFAIFFIFFGGWLVSILYGEKYGPAGLVIGWLGAVQATRLMRGLPGTAAVSRGDTKNMLISNIFRSSGLLGAMLVVYMEMAMVWVAIAALAGELVGYFVAIARLKVRHDVSMNLSLKPFALLSAAVSVSLVIEQGFSRGMPWYMAGLVTVMAITTYLTVGVCLLSGSRTLLTELWRQRSQRDSVVEATVPETT